MCERYDLIYHYHGKQYCEPGYTWGPGVKDHYKILFIHEGKGTYQINGITYTLQKGQGFMVFPNTICQMKADQQEPWVYSWIAFQGDYVEQLLAQVQLNKANPHFGFAPASWFDPWLEQLTDAHKTMKNSELIIHSILYRLFAEWIDMLTAPHQMGYLPKAKEVYVRKAIEYIKTNYYNKISINELASLIGIDRIYLSSLFKESVELSPQMYLLHYRMDRACDLLYNQQLTISDISHSVGYKDPLLFSKMFKKVKGISPSYYRTKLV
ncbi:AraC family transcriptional regulator [Paenibacillus sp. FSL H8-0548]|uniref:AraC family transcriptional regulator n=1 Tax=Paenibacillus sp. FSL H8-0548 TaxID=1920422 RepID=UPI00096FC27E|nr:AraC family transcriptional regulator [Paenibacillus sp. FSL H8-0548]OMF38357.1 AraC family transcriptional regulator [Paenibacillus sp. FSL H8-0548]